MNKPSDTIKERRLPVALMEILACPLCQAGIVWANTSHQALFCRYCKLTYTWDNDILQLRSDDGYEEH